jgi:hypothetical protein
MSEIEKKATQIAQESVINVQPFDFASIEYGAIKMGYWMKERMIEKACEFLDDRIGIDQKIEVNENGEPLADNYTAYCVARKQEAERIIKLFKQYMERE